MEGRAWSPADPPATAGARGRRTFGCSASSTPGQNTITTPPPRCAHCTQDSVAMEPRASLSCRTGRAPVAAVSVAENAVRPGPKRRRCDRSGRSRALAVALAVGIVRLALGTMLGVALSMAAAVAQAQGAPAADARRARLAVGAGQPSDSGPRYLGPLKTSVGGQATFALKITNNGATRLDKLLIVDEFDAGLKHEAGESPLEYELGVLEAGATKTVDVTFDVTTAGKLRHRVEIPQRQAAGHGPRSRRGQPRGP